MERPPSVHVEAQAEASASPIVEQQSQGSCEVLGCLLSDGGGDIVVGLA